MLFQPLLLPLASISLLFTGAVSAGALVARDVDDATFANLTYFSQYATAAYCPINNFANGVTIMCPGASNCGQLLADGARSVIYFSGNMGGANAVLDITGYVGVNDAKRLIIVAFRGTSGFRNILTDLRAVRVPAGELCDGCYASAGFWNGYKNVRETIFNAVKATAQAAPGYQVVVVGHSLGGALANYAATDLRNQNMFGSVDLYTYGAPRAGNNVLASYMNGQTPSRGQNYRVTHARDPVPRVPPFKAGYDHPYPQYFIASGNAAPVTKSDITVSYACCNQGDDVPLLSGGFPDIPAHLWYFAEVAMCSGMDIMPQGVTMDDFMPLANGTDP